MKTEVQIALFGIGAAIIGGLFSAGVTVWLNQKQLSMSYDRLRLEILGQRMEKLEATWKRMNELSADLKDPSLEKGSACDSCSLCLSGAWN